MKTIELTRGEVAIVDDDDYERLIAMGSWYIDNKGYAKGGSRLLMHRAIMNAPKGLQVDHIDGNPLNNRRSNLRLATHSQNQCNRGAPRNSRSGIKGVSWDSKHSKWQGKVYINNHKIYLGAFDSPLEAAAAYDRAAQEHHGDFAFQNNIKYLTAAQLRRLAAATA